MMNVALFFSQKVSIYMIKLMNPGKVPRKKNPGKKDSLEKSSCEK